MSELERVRVLCDLGRWPEAIEMVGRRLADDPADAEALCLLAQAHLGAGDARAALAAAQMAAAQRPEDDWPQRLQSHAFSRLGDGAGAATAARDAVRLAPESPAAHICAAWVLAKIDGAREEAAAAAARAVELAPLGAGSHVAAGAVAAAAGRRAEAEAAFRQALAIDPEDDVAHNELARLRLGSRWTGPSGLAAAAKGFATAVRVDPSSTTSRYNLEVVLRGFIARMAYFLFVAVYIIVRAGESSDSSRRPLLLALLAVPAWFAHSFLARLPLEVRSHLRRLPMIAPRLRAALGLEAFALLALVADIVSPVETRSLFAVLAILPALLARALIQREGTVAKAALRGERAEPSVTDGAMWAIGLAFIAFGFVLWFFGHGDRSLAIGLGAASVLAGAACLGVIARRRTRRLETPESAN